MALSASFLPGYKYVPGMNCLIAIFFYYFLWFPCSIPIFLHFSVSLGERERCGFLAVVVVGVGWLVVFFSLQCIRTTDWKNFACLDKKPSKTITGWKNYCLGVNLKEKTKIVDKFRKEGLRQEDRSGERRRVGYKTSKGKTANKSEWSGEPRKRQRVMNQEEPGMCESERNDYETWWTVKG